MPVKRLFQRNEKGSIPFAMLVAVITVVTSSMMAATLTWQARAAARENALQDARWAADSAANVALERLAVANPLLTGIPITQNVPATPSVGPVWRTTPTPETAMRWFVVRAPGSNDISVFAEGRTSGDYPVVHTTIMSMRFDRSANRWVTYRISTKLEEPSTAEPD